MVDAVICDVVDAVVCNVVDAVICTVVDALIWDVADAVIWEVIDTHKVLFWAYASSALNPVALLCILDLCDD